MADTEKPLFSFGQVRAILARAEGIHESKIKTFEARLQQLQKLGLPRGTNVGRSARAQYQGWQLAELALYLDLLDAGVAPAALQARFANAPFYAGGDGRFVEEPGSTQHLALHLNALNSLRSPDPGRTGPHAADHSTWTGPDPTELLAKAEKDQNVRSPTVILNLSARLLSLKAAVAEITPRFADLSLFPETWGAPNG